MKRILSVFLSALILPAVAGDWPQYLGPTRNGQAAPDEKAPAKLPAELKTIWRIKIGGGFSSPVVVANQLVYFDENGQKEVLHRLDARTGKEIWQKPIA